MYITQTRRLETRFRVIKSAHKRVLLATMPEHIATIVAKSVQRQQANDTQITTTAINMAGLRAAIAAVRILYITYTVIYLTCMNQTSLNFKLFFIFSL